ncbi:ATP-dependent DNA ligase [Paractinoplanes abujensis]|uniref:DNA ligase (ATP) n=1 Tax=Paractinoplanes abujensis TaxID=882441 RepID=A0A7W7CW44_9ACTN|nr:non-homologous end-joining DNA ligase [Actinoplanes abujensis]MBB4695746.1 bifunctional non-homologous end joining protein LigD [Actinoplanes abujensis]GID23330.1 ATP-dependent DNA ligase [Actinoplanes abujensis]
MPGAPLSPMLATSGALPVGPGWSYEFKWDGVRVLALFTEGPPDLFARSGAVVTAAYPEIADLRLPGGTLVDGEMVVLNAAGRPSFTALAERMHVRERHRAARLAVSLPVTYMIFDLLFHAGDDLTGLPYRARRERLEELGLAGPRWMVPPSFGDGPATADAARENSLEGVVAKREDSVYLPGLRSPDWVKVKFDRTGDYVIGGWRAGARKLGGLLVGVPTPDGLAFRGRVGGGIGAAAERELLAALEPLAQRDSPFRAGAVPREDSRGARWVRPELVVEVRYGNRTPDGRLRFPRFLRLRYDKSPKECVEEDEDGR